MTLHIRIASMALAVVTMVPVAAAAQAPSVTFGIKGGMNSATVKTDTDVERRTGIVGGLFLGGQIADGIGLQVEGLFSQRGGFDESGPFKIEYRVNYLDVPVLLMLGSGSDANVRFRVFGGGMASYKLKAEASAPSLGLTEDLDAEVEDLDFSGVVGAGLEVGRISVDARYAHGFTNFATTAGETAKNRTVALMVGLRLR